MKRIVRRTYDHIVGTSGAPGDFPGTREFSGKSKNQFFQTPSMFSSSATKLCFLNASSHVASGAPTGRAISA